MAERASGTFIYTLLHGKVKTTDFLHPMDVTINKMLPMLLMVTTLAGDRKMMSECHNDGRKLTFIEYLLDVRLC